MVPRRRLLRSLFRATLTSTVLVALYYALPLTGGLDGSAAIRLTVGLLAFCALVAWQVRAILKAEYPGLRVIEALAAAIPLFLLMFASTYFFMASTEPASFSEALTKTDALYFTVTVFATVGFGDITPTTTPARVVTIVQMLGDLLVVGVVLHVMIGAIKAGLQRRSAASDTSASAPERGPGG